MNTVHRFVSVKVGPRQSPAVATEVNETGQANQTGDQGQQGESGQANQNGDQGQQGELDEQNQSGDQGQK